MNTITATHTADTMYAQIVNNAADALAAGRTNVDGVDVHAALAHVVANAHGDDVRTAAANLVNN